MLSQAKKFPLLCVLIYEDPELTLTNFESPQVADLRISPLTNRTAYSKIQGKDLFQVIEYTKDMYILKKRVPL